jgi:tetratricopeptide (TPR) repeat protein
LEISQHIRGTKNVAVADTQVAQAEVFIEQGDFAQAETLVRLALATDQAGYPARHFAIGEAESALGWAYLQQGRVDEAVPLLEDAYSIAQSAYGAANIGTARSAIRLAKCLQAKGAKSRAAALVAAAGQQLDRSADPGWREDKKILAEVRR